MVSDPVRPYNSRSSRAASSEVETRPSRDRRPSDRLSAREYPEWLQMEVAESAAAARRTTKRLAIALALAAAAVAAAIAALIAS